MQSHFRVKPNLVLRLGWGFDNNKDLSTFYEDTWQIKRHKLGVWCKLFVSKLSARSIIHNTSMISNANFYY